MGTRGHGAAVGQCWSNRTGAPLPTLQEAGTASVGGEAVEQPGAATTLQCVLTAPTRSVRGIPGPHVPGVFQSRPIVMSHDGGTLPTFAPVAAGRVAARGRKVSLRVRARQHVMGVDGLAAARDRLALLGQRRLLGDIVGVGVKVLDALGYHYTLCVLPRSFADAVARARSRFAARLCRAEISPPIGVGRSCGPGERLAMRVGALDTAQVGAIALTHAGYEER